MKRRFLVYSVALLFSQIAASEFVVLTPVASKENNVSIKIKYSEIQLSDSITLLYTDLILRPNTAASPNDIDVMFPHTKITKVPSSKGVIEFTLNDCKPGYISVKIGNANLIIHEYFVEPGDDIDLKIEIKNRTNWASNQKVHYTRNLSHFEYSFSGNGFEKYKVRYATDEMYLRYDLLDENGNYSNKSDSTLKESLFILENEKNRLSKLAYLILKEDIISFYDIPNCLEIYNKVSNNKIAQSNRTNVLASLDKYLNTIDESITSDSTLITSRGYPFLLLVKSMAEYSMKSKTKSMMDEIYSYLKNKYNQRTLIRDLLLFLFFLNYADALKNPEIILSDLTETVEEKKIEGFLNEMYNNSYTGRAAFQFELPNDKGEIVRLKDYLNKVVFVDFWYTGCGACKGYFMNDLSKVEENFKNNDDIVFISISIDKDKEKWLNSIKKGGYTSTNSINLYTNGLASEHPMIKHYLIKSYPHPMIIDRNGRIFQFQGEDLREKDKLKSLLYKAMFQKQ